MRRGRHHAHCFHCGSIVDRAIASTLRGRRGRGRHGGPGAGRRNGYARREPFGPGNCRAGRHHCSRPAAEPRHHGDQPGPGRGLAVVQFSATRAQRRNRRCAAGYVARPRTRPDAGARQQQALALRGARERECHDRPWLVISRSEHHSQLHRANGRGAARRCIRSVRFRCNRGRRERAFAGSARRRRCRHELWLA